MIRAVQRRADLVLTIVVFALGAAFLVATQGIREGTVDDPLGERGLPAAVGILIIAGSIALAVQQVRSWGRPQERPPGLPDDPRYPASFGRAAGVFAALVAYVALLSWLGYFLATLAFVWVTFQLLRVPRTLRNALVCLLFTAAIYLLFTRALQVALPTGTLLDGLGW